MLGCAQSYEHNLHDERSVVDRHQWHMAAKFAVFVDENHDKHPSLYW